MISIKNSKLATGIGLALTGLIVLLKRKTIFSGFSGFAGTTNNVVQFTLTNNTPDQQTFSLFNAWGSGTDNPNVGIMPNPLQFNRQLMSQPVRVKSFEIRGPGAGNQANMPIQKMCIDSNGVSAGESYIPMMSAFQFQPGMITVQPANLVMDGECFLNYTLNPNTQVIFVMTYDQLKPFTAEQMKNRAIPNMGSMPRTQIQDKVKGLMDVGM